MPTPRSFSTELVHSIEGMNRCGLITTDLDQVAAGIKPVFFTAALLFYLKVSEPDSYRVGQVNRHLSTILGTTP